MKRALLLLVLTFAFFIGCSDNNGSSTGSKETADEAMYWKVTTRQTAQFTKNSNDGMTTQGYQSQTISDSVFLVTQGSDLTIFVTNDNGAYSKAVTNCKLNGPYFTISNTSVVDTSYESGNSPFVSFSGNIPIHIRGISILFHETDSTGKIGTIELESIEESLPSPDWTLSDEDLFVDWRTFFGF